MASSSGTKSPRVRERTLWVDTKQMQNHPLWAEDIRQPGTPQYEGFRVLSTAMDIGDYRINLDGIDPWSTRRLVVESKTWPDLHASARDNGAERFDTRLRHQLAGLLKMKQRGVQVAVLLIGQLTLAGEAPNRKRTTGVYVDVNGRRERREWDYFELEGIRTAIEHLGVMTTISPSSKDVPHTLWRLAEICSREKHFEPVGLPMVASLSPGLSQLATIFTAVPGIGPTTATNIAQHVKSFTKFMAMTQKELEQVPGVGKVTAAQLYGVFHSERDVGMPPMSELDPFESSRS